MKKNLLGFALCCCLSSGFAQSGIPDPTFGKGGIVTTNIGQPFNYKNTARQVLVQKPSGSIYIILDGTSITKRLPNGAIDSSYGTYGYSITIPLGAAQAALQADGKIVLTGVFPSTGEYLVARMKANGTPDSTFGNNGLQTTSVNTTAIAVQGDGKIVVAGSSGNNDGSFFGVARFNANGSPDITFNGTGLATTDFVYKVPGERGADSVEIHSASATTVAIQADGKIVAGGSAWTGNYHYFAVARYNVNGTADNTFDNDGKQTTHFNAGSDDFAYSEALQTDGKIVLAGYTSGNNFGIARYNTNGSLDNSFNGTGLQTAAIPSDGVVGNSVAIQSTGKIVVGGHTGNGILSNYVVARFNTNGSPDNSFDGDGILTTDIESSEDIGNSIAIQSDDKIILGGTTYFPGGSSIFFALTRYNNDGSLDNTFDSDGKLEGISKEGHTEFFATAIQTDGKVIAAGETWNGTDFDFAVVRYKNNGSIDSTFNTNGRLQTDFGGTDAVNSIVIQPDGKIIVAGSMDFKFAIARYNANGSPDNTFDGDGKAVISVGITDAFKSVALQKDGKIVMVGYSSPDAFFDSVYFSIVRLNSNGSIDNTFSGDGKQFTDFGSKANFASSVAIQNDGKIVVGGRTYSSDANQNSFSLARYNTDGTLDPSFSQDGKQTSVFGSDDYFVSSIAIQNDGKIVAAGYAQTSDGSSSSFAVARYQTNGELDNTFDGDGFQTTQVGTHFNYATSVAINTDGRIALGGTNDNFAIVLYKNNGSPDSTFGLNGIKVTNVGSPGSLIQSLAFANNKLYAAGTGTDRIIVGVVARYLLAEGGPLPVALVDFKAILQNKTTLLQWQTSSEQNLSGFIIQRSADDNTFSPIGYVAATGNSSLKINYSTIDKQPLTGVNFYRLQMVDKDGKVAYSRTVSVTLNDGTFTFNVFPNPAVNVLFVRATGQNEKATFQIIDAGGRTVKEVNVILNGNGLFPVYVSGLPKGIYNFKLYTKTKTETKTFVKE